MGECDTRSAGPRRRLRVAEILEPAVGGVRRHALDILAGLDQLRFDFTFIYSAQRDPGFRRLIPDLERAGVRCVEVPMARALSPAADLRAFGRLLRVLREGRFDVVHAHSSKAGALGRLAAWLVGVPRIVYTPHVYYFAARSGAAGLFFRLIEWVAGMVTSKVVAVSPGQREAAIRSGVVRPKGIVVVENGVDASAFDGPPDRGSARRRLGVALDRPVAAMVARLAPRKRCDLFLRVAARVRDRIPEACFLVAGDGEERGRLERLCDELGLRDCVEFLGHVEDPRPVYAASDVVVLTSSHEGLPYVLLEAMAAARPVVVTDVPGARDAVRHGHNGFLASADDAAGLARFVARLMVDEELRVRMGRRGRDLVERRFSLTRSLEETEDVLRGE